LGEGEMEKEGKRAPRGGRPKRPQRKKSNRSNGEGRRIEEKNPGIEKQHRFKKIGGRSPEGEITYLKKACRRTHGEGTI